MTRTLLLATRPAFLTAAVMPVLVGTAWGAASVGRLDAVVAGLAVLGIILVHAGSNVLNDVADAFNGTDAANTKPKASAPASSAASTASVVVRPQILTQPRRWFTSADLRWQRANALVGRRYHGLHARHAASPERG